MRRVAAWLGGLLAGTLIGGCAMVPGLHVSASPGQTAPSYEVVQVTPQVIASERQARSSTVDEPGQPALPLLRLDVAPPEYRLGPGDVINVIVWDHPELTNPLGRR
jgi:polysaccharide export outer membrane protein